MESRELIIRAMMASVLIGAFWLAISVPLFTWIEVRRRLSGRPGAWSLGNIRREWATQVVVREAIPDPPAKRFLDGLVTVLSGLCLLVALVAVCPIATWD